MGPAQWAEALLEITLAVVRTVPDVYAAFQGHHEAIKVIEPGRRRTIDEEIDKALAKERGA